MSNKIERRFVSSELRMDGGEGENDLGVIRGLAARYYRSKADQSDNLGNFRERLRPGCFNRCLSKNPDVRILFNHNPELILGRTGAGTAKVWETERGLEFSCNLPATTYAQDLRESIKRGDVSQCSFGMVVEDDEWGDDVNENGEQYAVRTVNTVGELLDCSPVTYPAYKTTAVSARDLWPEGVPASVRAAGHDPNLVSSYARNARRKLTNLILGA